MTYESVNNKADVGQATTTSQLKVTAATRTYRARRKK